MSLFAIVQTSYVSDLILNFSLRLVRFRTGMKIDAESWQVKPLQFSAELSKLSLETSRMRIEAPVVSVWISPLYILLGEVHLNNLELDRPQISGSLPPDFFDSKKEENPFFKNFFKKDVPTEVGKTIAKVVDQINRRNIYVEKVSVENARVDVGEIKCPQISFELQNLGVGQVHFDWNVTQFSIAKRLQMIHSFKGSFGLLKSTKDKYSLVIPTFDVALGNTGVNQLKANGSWPGENRLVTSLDLKELHEWIKGSSLLGPFDLKSMSGNLKADVTLKVSQNGFDSYTASVRSEDLHIEEFIPNHLDLDLRGVPNRTEITKLVIELPHTIGDGKDWNHRLSAENLIVENGQIHGEVKLNQAGLCGILLAAGVEDCFAAIKVSGPLKLEGKLDPLELNVTTNFIVEEGRVSTDPWREHKDSELLKLKTGQLDGTLTVFPKHLLLRDTQLSFGSDAYLKCDGDIVFKPTSVGLNVHSNKADLKKLLASFLDLEVRGQGDVDVRIDYAMKIPQAEGRTKVRGKVNLINAGVEGQNFGTLIGDLNYAKNDLIIGPLRLLNGGGRALIDGRLSHTPKGSFMSLGADIQRLEMKAITPDSGTEIFNGFINGKVALQGFTDNKSPEFLSGPFNLDVDNFKVFGVPFQRGKINALYQLRNLMFRQVVAERAKSTVTMTGTLNPGGGSELLFKSEGFPVRELGIEPKLKIFQKGVVNIDGWWRPAKGWSLKGKASQLRVAGRPVPDGLVDLGGEGDIFHFNLGFGGILKFGYKVKDSPDDKVIHRDISTELNNEGLYLGFAYLKEWSSPYPLDAKGSIKFHSVEDSGLIEVNDLSLVSTDIGSSAPKDILVVPGKHVLAWDKGTLSENGFAGTGKEDFSITSGKGSSTLLADYNLDLRLLDLIVPRFRFQGGRLVGKATMPLPISLETLTADAEIRNGSVFLDSLGHSIDSVRGNISIAEQNLNLRHIDGAMGAGEITLDGVYKLDPQRPVLSLQTTLDRAHLVLLEDLALDASGDVLIRGDGPPYSLGGRVQVSNAVYAKEFTADTTLPDPTAVPFLKFGLDVELGNSVAVRNSLADMTVGGRLLIAGTDIAPTMQGRVTLDRGAVIANENRFDLNQGYVDFPGGPTLDPILNLQASTQVQTTTQTYKIDLRALGPVKELNIEFNSDPPLANSDIVSLLAFGVLNSDTTQSTIATNDLIGAARVEALQMIFGKAIGSNIDRTTGFQVRLKADQDQRQQDFVPKVTVQRRLTDRASATYGQSLDATKTGKDLQVDYRLFNNMNLSGVWEETEDKETSVGVDLRFKFDIK